MPEIKTLQLRCCKKDFAELVSWKQTERYLEVKKYWETRVLESNWDYKSFDEVSIKNWYPADAPEIIFEFKANTWIVEEDWKNCFKIELGDIIEIKNYNND